MSKTRADAEFRDGIRRLGLTTAEVLYFLPQHPHVLQTFLWQTEDYCPDFPRVKRFTRYWIEHIHAQLHTVRVAHSLLATHKELVVVDGILYLH